MNKLKQIFLTAGMMMMLSSVFATTYYSKSSGDWNSSSTWSTVGFGSGTNTGSYPIAGDEANVGGGYTVTVNSDAVVMTMNFHSSTVGIVMINSGYVLEVDGVTQMYGDANTPSAFTGSGTVDFDGTIFVNSATGANYNGGTGGGGARIQCAMRIPLTIAIYIGGGTNTTCKMVVTGAISGAGGIDKAGTAITGPGLGQLELWSNNTYTGTTNVATGTLEVRAVNALGSTASGTTVTDYGELIILKNVNFASEALTLIGGTLTANDGNCTWNGTISVSDISMIRLIENGVLLDLNGNISLATACVLWFVGNTDGEIIVDGIISGSGSIVKTGQGMFLTLNRNNSFSGGVDLREGKINLGHASALGSSTLRLNQQTAGNPIKLDNTSGGSLTVTNAIHWNSPFAYMGTNYTNLTGTVLLGTAPLGRSVHVTGTLGMTGKVSGVTTTAFSKWGPGTLLFGNDNSYEGTTTILEGQISTLHRKAFGKSFNTIILTKGILSLDTDVSTVNYNVLVNGTTFTIISNRATAGAGIPHGFFDLSIGNSELIIQGGANVTSDNAWVIFSRDIVFTGSPSFVTLNGTYGTAKLILGKLQNGGNYASFSGNGEFEQKGKWHGTGGITLNSGLLRLDSANTYSGETKLNNGTLSLNHNQALGTVDGLFTINGGQILNSSNGLITITKDLIRFNGDFAYKGFTVANPETLVLNAAITMSGDRIIDVSNGTLMINGSINFVGQYYNITKKGLGILHLGTSTAYFNNVTINEGTFTAPNASGSLLIYGNFANNATFAHNSGKVTFKNASSKTIASSTGALNFWNVLKSGDGTNVVNCAVNVGGDAKFLNGTVSIGTGSLTFLDNATSSFGNNNSHVDGPVTKIGNDQFAFPTGDAGMLARMGITAPSSVTSSFTAQYWATSHSDPSSLGTGVNNVSVQEYWNLTQNVGASTVDVEIEFGDATFSGIQYLNTADLFVANYQGGSWEDNGGARFVYGSIANGGSAVMNGFNTFGDFTFGSQNGDNGLGGFIPSMVDAIAFSDVTNSGDFNGLEAAANLTDNNALTNKNYFGSITVYPNPSTGLINIAYPKGVTVTSLVITNMTGAQVFVATGMVNQIDLSELATGIYMVQINEANATTIKRLMIKK